MEEDRISALEGQLHRLMSELESERKARQVADRQLAVLLGAQREVIFQQSALPSRARTPTNIRDTTPHKSPRRVVSSSNSAQRGAGGNTPGPQTSAERRVFHTPRSSTPNNRREVSATPRSDSRSRVLQPSPKRAPSPRAILFSTSPSKQSTLELAWKKFANRVGQAMSEDELALVTAETLCKLLDNFGIVDDIERAQIEAQWTIFQREANDWVERSSAIASSLGIHDVPFNLRQEPGKPTLSRRRPLEMRSTPTRSSNPNEAGDPEQGSRTPRGGIRVHTPHSKERLVPVTSNPNAVLTRDDASYRKSCSQRVHNPISTESKEITHRGIGIVGTRDAGEAKLRGIKSFGSTHQCSLDDASTPRGGLRAGIAPRDEYGSFVVASEARFINGNAMRSLDSSGGFRSIPSTRNQGIRTGIESPTSPVAPRGTKAFPRRDSLVTAGVATAASPSRSGGEYRKPTPRQLKTPFAVDE